MHFHPVGGKRPNENIRKEYERQLETVVRRLKAHSPSATLFFALTTPPMDSPETTPDREMCPHYKKFHPKGFVPFLNEVATKFLPRFNVSINNRYQASHPVPKLHQRPCNIHFYPSGHQLLAKQDWRSMADIRPDLTKVK